MYQYGGNARGRKSQLTVHPAKPLPRDELEVDALITVFGINKVRQFHRIELYTDVYKVETNQEQAYTPFLGQRH